MRKAILVLLLAATSALAQTYPTKPIRILIAQAPGSATDVISRVVGNRLSEGLGQPVVIEAKPGAGEKHTDHESRGQGCQQTQKRTQRHGRRD